MFFLNGSLNRTLNTRRCCLSVLICVLCPHATLNTATRLASFSQKCCLISSYWPIDYSLPVPSSSPSSSSLPLVHYLPALSSALASSDLISPPLLPASSASHPLRFVSHLANREPFSGFSPSEPLKMREQHVFPCSRAFLTLIYQLCALLLFYHDPTLHSRTNHTWDDPPQRDRNPVILSMNCFF